MLDVFFKEDIENIIASVESMGGDLFTLNAIRRAFGLPMVGEADTQRVRYVTSTARDVEPARIERGEGEPLKEFDLPGFLRAKREYERQRSLR